MLLSAVSVLVVTQSSSEIPEGLMNNPVLIRFPRQQLLRERVLMLIYRYVECLVYNSTVRIYWVVGSSTYIAAKTSHKKTNRLCPFPSYRFVQCH